MASTDPNPIEPLWDVVERDICILNVQPTNVEQLCDAIMLIWTKIYVECFQHLVESMPLKIKASNNVLASSYSFCASLQLYPWIDILNP